MRSQFANILTGFRLLAAFVFLGYALAGDWGVAFYLFLIAGGTDLVDGTVARVFHQKSRLGAFLDPMADKTLMFFGFLTLTIGGHAPVWLFSLVVGRDLMITLGVFYFLSRRVRLIYQPTILSKANTLAQILYLIVSLSLLSGTFPPRGSYGSLLIPSRFHLEWVVALLTGATAVQYLRMGLRILRGSRGAQGQTGC